MRYSIAILWMYRLTAIYFYNAECYTNIVLPHAVFIYAVSIRPAAGCKYFLTIRPALLFCTPNRFISGQGRCPGRLFHVQDVRVRPGRLCYVLDVRVRVRVWYRFWFHYGIKHSCYRFKYVITSNIWCVAAWSDG